MSSISNLILGSSKKHLSTTKKDAQKKAWVQVSVNAFLLAALTACGGGGSGGCDALGPLSAPVPALMQFERAVEVKVSQLGMETIEDSVPTLLAAFGSASCAELPCPDGSGDRENDGQCNGDNLCVSSNPSRALMGFAVPESLYETLLVDIDICKTSQGATFEDCAAWARIDNINTYEVNGGDLRADVEMTAYSSPIHLWVDYALGWDGACYARIAPKTVTLTTDFTFDDDNPLGRLRIAYSELAIPLSKDDIEIYGGLDCSLADTLKGWLWSFIEPSLTETLTDTLDETLNSFLNESCADVACSRPDVSYCNATDELCHFNDGDATVPTLLGIEGGLDLESLLGGLAGNAQNIDFTTYANQAEANGNAMNLRLKAGFNAARSDCVPDLDPSNNSNIAPYLLDDTTPNGSPYHAAIGVSKGLFDGLLYSAFDSGALCQSLDGAAIPQLTSGALSLLMPSLSDLTGGESVPLGIDILPRSIPRMEVGKNITSTDADGAAILEEPLLNLVIDDLDLDIYAQIGPGLLRIITLRADLVLDLSLVPNAGGELQLVVGDPARWIRNLEVLNADLLREDPAEIEAALPALLGAVLPALTGALSNQSFVIPAVSGFGVNVHEITGTGAISEPTVDGFAQFHHMSIFTDVTFDPTTQPQQLAALKTRAKIVEIKRPSVQALRLGEKMQVVLDVDAENLSATENLIVWHRVDEGPWRPLTKGRKLVVKDSILSLPGMHRIEVRAARQGLPQTLDDEGVVLEVFSDFAKPEIALLKEGHKIRIQTQDFETKFDALSVLVFVDGLAQGEVLLDEQGEALLNVDARLHEVKVRVRDLGEHVAHASVGLKALSEGSSAAERAPLLDAEEKTRAVKLAPSASGCSQYDASFSSMLLGLLLLLLPWRRMRP